MQKEICETCGDLKVVRIDEENTQMCPCQKKIVDEEIISE